MCQPAGRPGEVREVIEGNPSFGYRTVAHLLCFNMNTLLRCFSCVIGR